jgi:hypothetical protein
MIALTRRSLTRAAVACLLIVGIFTPVAVMGQEGASAQTQSQLMAMVAAAQSSGVYAHSAVEAATSHGLSVAAALAKLSQGDSMLAVAQADARSGTNITGGIQAAQAAMGEYTNAAALATVALTNAGLTTSVGYAATLGAVAEVNASESAVSEATAKACGQAGARASNSSAFAQACAQAGAQLTAASADLSQAYSFVVRSSGQANATANLSQAVTLIATARSDVSAAQSYLVTIASYTYAQRGHAYVASIVGPLSSKANATIMAEQSFQANLTRFQSEYIAHAKAQASGVANLSSGVSALASAISLVSTTATSASINSSQSVAASTETEVSSLLGLPGISLLTSVVTDIHGCNSAAAAYSSSLAIVGAGVGAFESTSLTSFATYSSSLSAEASSATTAGSTFSSSCQKVVTDISVLLSTPGVQAIYNALTALHIAATVNGTSSSLYAEATAVANVQASASAAASTLASSQSSVLLGGALLSAAASGASEGGPFLNATASASLSQADSSVQATGSAAQSYIAEVNSGLNATVGAFATEASSLTSSGATLVAQTNSSVSSTASAVAYVSSDVQVRVAEAASGQASVSEALHLFSSLNISGGAAALAQASNDFQAAGSVSA